MRMVTCLDGSVHGLRAWLRSQGQNCVPGGWHCAPLSLRLQIGTHRVPADDSCTTSAISQWEVSR